MLRKLRSGLTITGLSIAESRPSAHLIQLIPMKNNKLNNKMKQCSRNSTNSGPIVFENGIYVFI